MYNKLNLWLDVPEQPQRKTTYALVDQNLKILHQQHDAGEWMGVEPESFVNHSLSELLPELQNSEAELQKLVSTRQGIFTLSGVHRVTSYAEDRYFDIQVEPLLHGEAVLIVTIVDVTRQVHLEQRLQQYTSFRFKSDNTKKQLIATLQQRNRDLLLLNRVGQDLTATLSIQDILERLLQVAVEVIGAEGGSVWLWDDTDPPCLECHAVFNKQDTAIVVGQRLQVGQGIAGWVAENGESTAVRQVRDDPRFYDDIDRKSGFVTVSLLAVPLRARGTVIGVFEVVNKMGTDFTSDDMVIAETLAASASIAIDNARLIETLRDQTSDLQARNEELDAFAHTVAHDLQNPIALLIGYAGLLYEDIDTLAAEKRSSILQLIITNARKVSNIVEELLILSSVRKMEVETRPLKMSDIVTSALDRLAHLLEEHRAEVTLPDNWPVALGHSPWVEEVWENYLSNAIKYGGRPPRLELGGERQPDNTVRFWVRDNGQGLSEEAQSHLFTPVTKLSDIRATGHGLGLSIVRRIVQKLGGQVGVESEVGAGSVFSFTLPGTEQEMEVRG